jgi:DNA-binding NtrC family response regulator
MNEKLQKLVDEMVERGVRFPEATDSDGNLSKAADALGIHRNTLSRKMTELRLKRRAQP